MIEIKFRTIYSYGCGLVALLHMCEFLPEAYERHWWLAGFHAACAVFAFWAAHEYGKPEDKSWL
jgi:hypothetical protein